MGYRPAKTPSAAVLVDGNRYPHPVTPEPVPQRLTASQRLAVAMGRPIPPPPTEEDRRAWEAKQDEADREVWRLYVGDVDS